MNTLNELKCSCPARSENESFARTMVCAFAAQLDPTVEELADLRTAVSEAVTNSIVHAYRDAEPGLIAVTVRLLPQDIIYIRIADKGCGIADIGQAMQPLYSSAPTGCASSVTHRSITKTARIRFIHSPPQTE